MPERLLEVMEFLSVGECRLVSVEHGDSLIGRNVHTVWSKELCRGKCDWCEALVRRCKSRGGGIGGYQEKPTS